MLLAHYSRIQEWLEAEQGQDLVEFSLVIGLVAFGALMILKVSGIDLNAVLSLLR